MPLPSLHLSQCLSLHVHHRGSYTRAVWSFAKNELLLSAGTTNIQGEVGRVVLNGRNKGPWQDHEWSSHPLLFKDLANDNAFDRCLKHYRHFLSSLSQEGNWAPDCLGMASGNPNSGRVHGRIKVFVKRKKTASGVWCEVELIEPWRCLPCLLLCVSQMWE